MQMKLGHFSFDVTLQEGENTLSVVSRYQNRNKLSSESPAIKVTLDRTVPDAPRGFNGLTRAQGDIRLSWQAVEGNLAGYHIYRSTSAFSSIHDDNVVRLTNSPVKSTSSQDLTDDGIYFYAVSAITRAGTESAISELISIEVDTTGPLVEELQLDSNGLVAEGERYGMGTVDVQVRFSEALRNPPFFAFSFEGTGIPVSLSKDFRDDRLYTGSFNITENTPSGVGLLTYQTFDIKGNTASEKSGEAFEILVDTQGPEITELMVNPLHPIANDGTTRVEVQVQLNDDINQSFKPVLTPEIDGEALVELSEGIPLAKDSRSTPGAEIWKGSFDLPASAGQDNTQYLSFEWQARDDLENTARRVHGNPRFQVYQGELPALASPIGLQAEPRPDAEVYLEWDAVDEASGYQIYRKAKDASEFSMVAEVEDNHWLDDTGLDDGSYLYSVASVRKANEQTAVSEPGQAVSVVADGMAPGKPLNVRLRLNGAGMVIEWDAPEGTSDHKSLTYNLYRLDTGEGELASIEGVTPLKTRIPGDAFIALDEKPSETEHTYTVTAVDSAGNQSAPADPDYLNAGLLPVGNLEVRLEKSGFPKLSWTHSGRGIAGYDVYRGEGSDRIKLNEELITAKQYIDRSYNGGQGSDGASMPRHYHVVAVDAHKVESIEHSLLLPALTVEALPDQPLLRGIMNPLKFRVNNYGNQKVSGMKLRVQVKEGTDTRNHQSGFFSVDAGSFTEVAIVVGGYQGLNALTGLTLSLHQTPKPGESVTIVQGGEMAVGDSGLIATVSAEELLRGATGKARFTLENTSEVTTEILMARGNGNSPSSEVRFVLTDREGNVFGSSTPVRQFTGDVIALANGDVVARLEPGTRFTSELTTLNIPQGAPDDVQMHLKIDRLHYRLGKAEQVSISGLETRQDLTLVETEYFGEVTAVGPEKVWGTEPVTIAGKAILREDNSILADAALDLIFNRQGYEKQVRVVTDEKGVFSYQYKPSKDESGQVQVTVVYPNSSVRPWHDGFLIENASVKTPRFSLGLFRNIEQPVSVRVRSGRGTTLENLRLEMEGSLPEGMSISLPEVIDLQPNREAYLKLRFSADNNASTSGRIDFKVKADNTEKDLGTVQVDFNVREARAALTFRPGNIETGVTRGSSVIERLTLSNNSNADVDNIRLQLKSSSGPAPAWLKVVSGQAINQIAVGDNSIIDIQIAPPEGLTEGNYTYFLHVSTENAGNHDYPIYVAVTQSGIGEVFFHASDIYTATLDENGQPIRGLSGARIKLQNEQVLTEVYSGNTDQNGNLLLRDIPAGRYLYRASARDHEDVSGRLWVKPGIVTAEEVFLTNNLITVEWEVKEITLEDRYEINLVAEFKTKVPVAVVTFEPSSVNLPTMKKGDVINGEFTLTNHGLIRADNVQGSLPTGNDVARFDYLQDIPETLEPGEVYTIPYRGDCASEL